MSSSQMAEAVAKHLSPPKVRIFSAGVTPATIPVSVHHVVQELGISMAAQKPKGVDEVPLHEVDLVVSFAGADKKCPALPSQAKINHGAITSPALALDSDFANVSMLRRERDEINRRVFALFMDYWRSLT